MSALPKLEQIENEFILQYSLSDAKTGERLGNTYLKAPSLQALIYKLAESHREAVLLNARLKRKYQK